MSDTKKDTELPLKNQALTDTEIARIVADALRQDFGSDPSAVKQIGLKTGLNIRTIKSWYEARRAPSSAHLLILAKHSFSIRKFLITHITNETTWSDFEIIMNASKAKLSGRKKTNLRRKNDTLNDTLNLNKRQKWFLIQLKNRGHGSAENIVQEFGASLSTARRDLLKLKQAGKILFYGSKKTGCYKIVN